MRIILYISLVIIISSCVSTTTHKRSKKVVINQSELSNTQVKEHTFLDCMYNDSYFPKFLVDKCKNIMLKLCKNIENDKPLGLDDFYKMTHNATNQLNNLQNEFFENQSELETVARECLALDFEFIAITYGFDPDIEEMIATREW